MSWNRLLGGGIILGLALLIAYTIHDLHPLERPATWQVTYSPGKLSRPHAFLSHQCTSCHVPGKGVTEVGCVTCHSSNEQLLKRESTAFHANISSCKECHREHQGGKRGPVQMDHEALAKLGIRSVLKDELGGSPSDFRLWMKLKNTKDKTVQINPHEPAVIGHLNCVSCHKNQDIHRGLMGSGCCSGKETKKASNFGTSCLNCHVTKTWKISGYRHPSPNNRSCVQCHQAPPSHFMEHFSMISQKIAGQEKAGVNQCFLCHKTNSWNDIQGVGWYKHH